MAVESVPFGPVTVRVLPSWRTSTPFGSGIGFFPIRDMGLSLPDLAEDLAADAALGRLGARQDALRRRDDGEAETVEDARDLLLVAVDAAAGARDALDAVDDRLAVGRVLEVDPQRPLRLFLVRERVVADEALALENAGDLHLQLRGGELHAVVMRRDPVPDSRQHIGYWVCHRHSVIPLVSSECCVLSAESCPSGLLSTQHSALSTRSPTRLGHSRDISPERKLPEADAAELELAQVSARTSAHLAAVLAARHELRLALRLDDHGSLGHLVLSAYLPNGMPSSRRRKRACSSFFAVVTMVMFIPLDLSTLATSISGKMTWSRTPRV